MSQGFKIKEIGLGIVLSISSVHLPVQVQVTWWFLASDGSEIQSGADDFRSIN